MSFASDYQGRKTLLANLLVSKGVSAVDSEGLTTLINKVDDISSGGFDNGVFLVADKDIIQKDSNVRLSAIAVQDDKLRNSPIAIYKITSGLSNDFSTNANGFVAVSSHSNISISNSMGVVGAGVSAYCNVPVVLEDDIVFIRFKCKSTDGNEGLTAQIGYNNASAEYDTTMYIDSSEISFFEETISLPEIMDIEDWIDVAILCTPTAQKVWVNDTLITASKDFTDGLWEDNRYFTVWQWQKEWNIKDFQLNVLSGIATGSNGSCSGTFTGVGGGKTDFIAISYMED